MTEVTTEALDTTEATPEVTTEVTTEKTEVIAEDKNKDVPEPRVVPETYEFTGTEEAIPEVIEAYKGAAKEAGITNAEAQTILSKVLPVMAEQQAAQHAAMVESWANEVKADKEIGGAKLDANLAVAKKGVEAVGGKDLVDFFNSSGLGNHPLLVKAFYNVGMKISEDNKFINGGSGIGKPSIAQAMFPNMNP
jgi:hypothetical protein